MGALAHPQVGEFIDKHFVSTHVKVGTFRLVNGKKQGGNVASYFCLPDGRVLHAIAGPLDANQFLFEARWVVNLHKQALFAAPNDPARYQETIRAAQGERAAREYHVNRGALTALHQKAQEARAEGEANDRVSKARLQVLDNHRQLANAGRIHVMLALFPLARVEDIYKYVFEDILNEKVTALPVVEK